MTKKTSTSIKKRGVERQGFLSKTKLMELVLETQDLYKAKGDEFQKLKEKCGQKPNADCRKKLAEINIESRFLLSKIGNIQALMKTAINLEVESTRDVLNIFRLIKGKVLDPELDIDSGEKPEPRKWDIFEKFNKKVIK